MKKAAVINDLSGFGKCSLTAAIPVLSALGVQCCPLATAVLTGQTGYPYFHCTDLTEMMPQYTDAWTQNQVHFDAIYSGMTGRRQIEHLLDLIAHFRYDDTLLLVDPVMGDDGRVYGIYSEDLLAGMKELSRKADVITPNLTEACLLSDTDIAKATDYTDADSFLHFASDTAAKLRDMADGPQDVVITGVKCQKEETPFIYRCHGAGRTHKPFASVQPKFFRYGRSICFRSVRLSGKWYDNRSSHRSGGTIPISQHCRHNER